MFLEVAVRRAVVVGAEVGADAVGGFGGAVVQRRGRPAGRVLLLLVVVVQAGGAVEPFVFCVQVVLGKLRPLLHKAPELVCGTTTGGRQRRKNKKKKRGTK